MDICVYMETDNSSQMFSVLIVGLLSAAAGETLRQWTAGQRLDSEENSFIYGLSKFILSGNLGFFNMYWSNSGIITFLCK